MSDRNQCLTVPMSDRVRADLAQVLQRGEDDRQLRRARAAGV
jgi:hypothetical protein